MTRPATAYSLLLLTGMRSQELLALEAGHIEPDGSCVHIRQAVKQVKGTVFVGATKSATSVRDVPIPEAYRDMVKRLRTYCTPYLWTGKGGDKPCNPTHFRDKFAAAIESVPGVRPLTPHSCRHTFVSQLQAQGVPMETIQVPRRSRGDRHDGALSPRPERRQNRRRRKPRAADRGVAKRPIASIVSKRDSGTILVRVLV